MIQAESLENHTGEEKKNAVLGWVKDFCEKQGYKFNPDEVSSAIETLINFSKKVNKRDKDSEEKVSS